MTTLIFATNNEHKVSEIQSLLPKDINVITLQQAGINIDIPEPYDTLKENANTKAKTIFEITKQNCFSEDTGLEIDALNGAPGVHSARYAGADRNFNANNSDNVGIATKSTATNSDKIEICCNE